MPVASPTRLIVTLARAGIKAATAKLRSAGVTPEFADWPTRAEACAGCPLRVEKCGVSYCGQPLLRRVIRDPAREGCGCPTVAKAKDPAEHCPITPTFDPSDGTADADGTCGCKWCVAASRLRVLRPAA